MTIAAYSALHYGRDYLHHAIRSIIDEVDTYIVLYTPVGSHGHRTDAICPDTREELYDIASAAAGEKLRWFDGEWPYEGAQRDAIFQIVPQADVIVVLDADEIWPPGLLRHTLEGTAHWHRRDIRMPMVHYWRALDRAILHDPACPVRLIYPHIREGAETFTPDSSLPWPARVIHHYGYAQRAEIVRYKLLTHGHKNEFRQDCNWFQDIFLNPSRTRDLHPVGSEYWNTETVSIPDFMQDHPYAKLSVIE